MLPPDLEVLLPKQFLDKRIAEVIPPPAADIVNEAIIQAGHTGNHQVVEYALQTSTGSLWYELTVLVLPSPPGSNGRLLLISKDITEPKELEAQSREMRERLHSIYVASHAAIITLDLEMKVTGWSPAAERMFGWREDEVLGRPNPVVPTEKLEEFKSDFLKSLKKGSFVREMLRVKKDNTPIFVALCTSPLLNAQGEVVGVVGVFIDITGTKQTEEELRSSLERLHLALDAANAGIWEWNLSTGKSNWSDELWGLFGLEPRSEEPSYELWRRTVHPEDLPKIERSVQESIKRGVELNIEWRVLRYDGQIRWLMSRGQPIYDANGSVSQFLGIVLDITQRKNAEKLLGDSEERYRRLFEVETDAIVLIDRESGQILDVNQAALRLYGYTRKEFLLLKDYELSEEPEASRQAVASSFDKVPIRFHQKKDGTVFPVEISGGFYDYQGRQVHVAAIRDISERMRAEKERQELEAKAQQAHKLESLGVLAGGIAHDFNNLLFGLFGYIDRAWEHTKKGEIHQIAFALEKAGSFLGRARDLTQQLLTFAKGGAPIKKVTNISPLLEQAAVFALSGSNLTLDMQLAEDLWPCEVDENQISQALDNILRNARDAMPEGGAIRVSAKNIVLEKVRPKLISPGRYLHISIKDNGPGIPVENLPKVFDPFYTTKEKGHGLGLAIVYSIINKHQGSVEVESELGKGTTFHIYLPACDKPVGVAQEEKRQKGGGKGRILVMDDEPGIRQLACEMLESLGCSTESAADGEEAIALYQSAKKEGQAFDAVILDLTVRGGMGGKETMQALLKIDPEVKAIVSSGYATDPVISAPTEYGFKATLAKPYRMQEMVEVVGKVILKIAY